MTTSRTDWAMRGSRRKARAMFVSGPMGTRVISPGEAMSFSMITSTACESIAFICGCGNCNPPSPLSPCTCSAYIGWRTSGRLLPRATGISVRPANSSSASALYVVRSTLTLPPTVVMASSRTSGEDRARKSARASSMPGSVSSIIRCICTHLFLFY